MTQQPGPTARCIIRGSATLDPRSLACLRTGLALTLLWDMGLVLAVADDWWSMQGYAQMPLPEALVLGSPATTLRLAALGLGVMAVCLGLGWQTRWTSLAAWAGACAYQYAGHVTGDYHNAVLCTLLLWGLALPLGERWSLDARAGRRPRQAPWLVRAGGAGLVLSLAWIYLSTAALKSGQAWWDGSAVWLALLDRGTETGLGRWVAAVAPAAVLRVLTWAVLAVEWIMPVLIAWSRTRWLAFCSIVALHGGMWLLMDLGSFPLVMISAGAALIPARVWDGGPLAAITGALEGGGARPPGPEAPSPPPRCWLDRATLAVQVAAILVTIEGYRLATRADGEQPYPGARQVSRARYLLGLEARWAMYAPEPFADAGWWVGVAWRADGRLVDPITGAAPRLDPPPAAGPVARLRWLFLSETPWVRQDGAVPAHTYLDFLLVRRRGEGEAALERLVLLWVHEPLTPFEMSSRRQPLLVAAWPAGSVTAQEVALVLGQPVSRPSYDEDGYFRGPASEPFSPPGQSVP